MATPGAPSPPALPESRRSKSRIKKSNSSSSSDPNKKALNDDVRMQLKKAISDLASRGSNEPPSSIAFVYCHQRYLDAKHLCSYLRKHLLEALHPLDEARALGVLRVLHMWLRSRLNVRRLERDERIYGLLSQLCRSPLDRLREEASRVKCSLLVALKRHQQSPTKRNLVAAARLPTSTSAIGDHGHKPFWAHTIEVLADVLCATEWQHVSRLHFTDFVIKGRGLALRAYIERTNLISEWVATNILVQRSAKQQCLIFGNFVRIAHKCLEFGGFNVASAIISGCRHGYVERLHRTWVVPRNYAYLYELVGAAVSPTRGYAAYRASLDTAMQSGKPYLPIVALVLRDLTLVEDGNPDVLDGRRVNVDKLECIHRALAPVLRSTVAAYKMPTGDGLEHIARHMERLPCRPLSELEVLSAKFRPYALGSDTSSLSDDSSLSVRSFDTDTDGRPASDVNVSDLVELALDSSTSSASDSHSAIL